MTFGNFTMNKYSTCKIIKGKRPHLSLRSVMQPFRPCGVEASVTVAALLLPHRPKQQYRRSHTFLHALLCLLCAVSFLDFLNWGWKRKQLLARTSIISLGYWETVNLRMAKAVDFDPVLQNTRRIWVKRVWKEDLFLYFPLALKWLNGNTGKPSVSTANVASQEFTPAFGVISIISIVILKHCDFFQISKWFPQWIFPPILFSSQRQYVLSWVCPSWIS